MADSPTKSGGFQDRALIVFEVIVGLMVVAAIMGKAYGPAPTVIFMLCGLALSYTAYNVFKIVTSLGDATLELQGRTRDETREALEYEKKLLLQGIKELEVDYGVGKVDHRDYETLRKTAEGKAITIINKLREDDARWESAALSLVEKRVPGLAVAARGQAPATPAPAPAEEDTAPDGPFDDRPAVWRAEGDGFVCTACGTENEADGEFCVGCGRPRAAEAA